MTPVLWNATDERVPPHGHTKLGDGGELESYLKLNRTTPQAMVGDLVVAGSLTAAGANLTGATALPNLNTTPLQSVIGAYVCLLGAVAVTDAREWLDPDASGERVVSKPIVDLVDQAATATGNVLVAPDPGTYAFLVCVDNAAALAAGTVLAALSYVARGGARTQSPLPALVLTAEGAQSFMVACKVASGDVTYAFTVAGAVGTPSYDVQIIPLGRFA